MTTSADKAEATTTPTAGPPQRKPGSAQPLKAVIGIVGIVITIAVVGTAFQAMNIYDVPRILQAVVAIVAGVGGAGLLFYFINQLVEALPLRLSLKVIPYAFLLPAFGLLIAFLIYPTIQTIIYSFANDTSTEFVGFDNYTYVFGDEEFRRAIVNTLLWLAIVPAVTVIIGLAVAVLADKLAPTAEKVAKSLIFLPMAISMVGAATIWRFVYAFEPKGDEQVGLLNAVWTSLGFDPVSWLQTSTLNFNDVLLMVILIWLQAGFAMVLLSAAIKGVPEDTLEAARIDGANERKIFFQVVVPQIRGTIIAVFITVLLMVLKVFDIVYVITNGNFETNVIAVLFVQQIFQFGENGRASAIVVLLLLAVLPALYWQVRHFREEEANR
ncbi:MAG TPA: sugar ABC transporter permease [Nocardioidaceae bacterium]|nr:sugar ABC transporter permease [Nocardioidaceae bacterium]